METNSFKIKKFSGLNQEWFSWKSDFLNSMWILDLGEVLETPTFGILSPTQLGGQISSISLTQQPHGFGAKNQIFPGSPDQVHPENIKFHGATTLGYQETLTQTLPANGSELKGEIKNVAPTTTGAPTVKISAPADKPSPSSGDTTNKGKEEMEAPSTQITDHQQQLQQIITDQNTQILELQEQILQVNINKQQKYTSKNAKVYAHIMLALDRRIQQSLEQKVSRGNGREAWNYLVKLYERDDVTHVNNLYSNLHKIKLANCENDIEIYLTKIHKIATQIREAKGIQALDDAQIIATILTGLTEEYKSWANKKGLQKNITIDEVEFELCHQFNFNNDWNEKLEENNSDIALNISTPFNRGGKNFQRGNFQKRGNFRGRSSTHTNNPNFSTNNFNGKSQTKNQNFKDTILCQICNKSGHVASTCYKYINKNSANHTTTKSNDYGNYGNNSGHYKNNSGNFKNNSGNFKSHDNMRSGDYDDFCAITSVGTNVPIAMNSADKQPIWCIDSAATMHMCNDNLVFEKLTTNCSVKQVVVADNHSTEVKGIGNIKLKHVDSTGVEFIVEYKNVLYVPKLRHNLLSVPILTNMGHAVLFDQNNFIRFRSQSGIEKDVAFYKKQKLYFFSMDVKSSKNDNKSVIAANLTTKPTNLEIWHNRLGHANFKMIKKLSESVEGLNINFKDKNSNLECEVCVATKMVKQPFFTSTTRATKPLERIHTDISGPFRVNTKFDSHRYLITFTDDFSRFVKVYTMKYKSDTLKSLQKYIADIGKPETIIIDDQTKDQNPVNQRKIRTIRSDNGGEYTSNAFKKFCIDNGIKNEYTIVHTPEQNGTSERQNRTLTEGTRAILKAAQVPPEWWGCGVKTIAYIRNRCLTSANSDNKTPYELFYGTKPNISHFRTFGCKVYIYNEDVHRDKKLGDRAIPGMFVGYGDQVKGYIVYVPSKNKLIASRNVKFFENQPYFGSNSMDKSNNFDEDDGEMVVLPLPTVKNITKNFELPSHLTRTHAVPEPPKIDTVETPTIEIIPPSPTQIEIVEQHDSTPPTQISEPITEIPSIQIEQNIDQVKPTSNSKSFNSSKNTSNSTRKSSKNKKKPGC